MESHYNTKSLTVRRILREHNEIVQDPPANFVVAPLEDSLFEWHFSFAGAPETDFSGGLYHGKILLPVNYPFKPPTVVMLNQNGRFDVGIPICLSATSYHPELWQASWSMKTLIIAIQSFMLTPSENAVGSVDGDSSEKKRMAIFSRSFKCSACNADHSKLLHLCNFTNSVESLISNAVKSDNTTQSSPVNTETKKRPMRAKKKEVEKNSPRIFEGIVIFVIVLVIIWLLM